MKSLHLNPQSLTEICMKNITCTRLLELYLNGWLKVFKTPNDLIYDILYNYPEYDFTNRYRSTIEHSFKRK